MYHDRVLQAKRVQLLVEGCLFDQGHVPFTDIEVWTKLQQELVQTVRLLMNEASEVPEEEGEMVLAILMSYLVTVRNEHYIRLAMERAEKVFPMLQDRMLQCQLAVFGYGVSMQEVWMQRAHRLLEAAGQSGHTEEVLPLEQLMMSFE